MTSLARHLARNEHIRRASNDAGVGLDVSGVTSNDAVDSRASSMVVPERVVWR
jgi:hypothetical protein